MGHASVLPCIVVNANAYSVSKCDLSDSLDAQCTLARLVFESFAKHKQASCS